MSIKNNITLSRETDVNVFLIAQSRYDNYSTILLVMLMSHQTSKYWQPIWLSKCLGRYCYWFYDSNTVTQVWGFNFQERVFLQRSPFHEPLKKCKCVLSFDSISDVSVTASSDQCIGLLFLVSLVHSLFSYSLHNGTTSPKLTV